MCLTRRFNCSIVTRFLHLRIIESYHVDYVYSIMQNHENRIIGHLDFIKGSINPALVHVTRFGNAVKIGMTCLNSEKRVTYRNRR